MSEAEVVRLKPWITTAVVHVYPGNDLIEHSLGQECICSPTATVFDEGGTKKGIEVVHRALDGRRN